MRRLSILAAALMLSACGGDSYLSLTVSGDLDLPVEADELSVHVVAVDEPDALLLERSITLSDGDTLPLVIILELTDAAPDHLEEHLEARLDGHAVAVAVVRHRWREAHNNTFEVELTRLR